MRAAVPRRWTLRWLLLTVALLPLLVPRGPGATAPVDVAATLLVLSVAAAVLRRRHVPVPALVPVLALVTASLLSTAVNPSGTALLTVVVEVYLFAVFVAACSVLADREDLLARTLVVWSACSLLWAALVLGTYYDVLPAALSDLLRESQTSARVSGAARNPNLAASYLATSAFVVLASPWPRSAVGRWAVSAVLVLAVWSTGSTGALLAVVVGLALLAVLWLLLAAPGAARQPAVGLLVATGAVAVGAVLVALGPPQLDGESASRIAAQSRGGTFDDSLGRLDHSVESRSRLWASAFDSIGEHPALGVGPGTARSALRDEDGPLRRGVHNDYLALAVERGLLGLLAGACLLAVVTGWCRRVGRLAPRPSPSGRWRPAALTGAAAVNAVIALTHESLHFRHLWVLLALVWAASRLAPPAPRPAPPLLEVQRARP